MFWWYVWLEGAGGTCKTILGVYFYNLCTITSVLLMGFTSSLMLSSHSQAHGRHGATPIHDEESLWKVYLYNWCSILNSMFMWRHCEISGLGSKIIMWLYNLASILAAIVTEQQKKSKPISQLFGIWDLMVWHSTALWIEAQVLWCMALLLRGLSDVKCFLFFGVFS